ncbi:hypothetical protein HA402_015677 [Bradysia odoriphaga]|nr:hypothetical protein HA402_015677 [Bradysia odoriphaga]
MIGSGCLEDAAKTMKEHGLHHALIVTDKVLNGIGVVAQVQALLAAQNIESCVYGRHASQPDHGKRKTGPGTVARTSLRLCRFLWVAVRRMTVQKGLPWSPLTVGKSKTMKGLIAQLSRSCRSSRSIPQQVPASEMTRFCIITDEARHIKMAIVDKHVTPILSVNDPHLMAGMPKGLTAATGMDALTHAIEAYVSSAANPITDACALKAATMIAESLRDAVNDGQNMQARENMAYAQFLAGMAFNNASLGFVHAMAHQLGGFYNLPHGVCNAVLLPHVQEFNTQVAAGRLKDIAAAMGDVGIPAGLRDLQVKEEDFATLATNALNDACGFTNPIQASHEQIVAIFKAAM